MEKEILVMVSGDEVSQESVMNVISNDIIKDTKSLPFKGNEFKVAKITKTEEGKPELVVTLEGENFDEMNESTHLAVVYNKTEDSYNIDIA